MLITKIIRTNIRVEQYSLEGWGKNSAVLKTFFKELLIGKNGKIALHYDVNVQNSVFTKVINAVNDYQFKTLNIKHKWTLSSNNIIRLKAEIYSFPFEREDIIFRFSGKVITINTFTDGKIIPKAFQSLECFKKNKHQVQDFNITY